MPAYVARFEFACHPQFTRSIRGLSSPAIGPVTLFERPDGLAGSNGTWTGTYASIDETSANDSDYIGSPSSPTSSNYYEVTLSDVTAPANLTDVVVRYRYAKSSSSGQTINLMVELRQGSTVIASQAHSNISSSWTAGSFTLSAAERASITDATNLRLRFRPTTGGGSPSRSARISWAEVQLDGNTVPAESLTYAYDGLSRLTGVSGSATRSYTYDPAGNRLTKVAGATTTYTCDRADRITAAGATSITVNAVGATTARGSDTFTYDQANRLTGSTVSGVSSVYTYDGDGTRFSQQVGGGSVTRYVTDPNRDLPVTISDGTRKYVYGLGLAYNVAGTTVEVYHGDRLGTVRELSDAAGALTVYSRSDEFGNPTLSVGTSAQPQAYTGEPKDASGLTYLRARYYDPALGRFMTRDTWGGLTGLPISQNRYTYVHDDPTTAADPSGHIAPLILAGIIGGVVGAAINTVAYAATNVGHTTMSGLVGAAVGGAIAGSVTAVSAPLGFAAALTANFTAGVAGSVAQQQIATVNGISQLPFMPRSWAAHGANAIALERAILFGSIYSSAGPAVFPWGPDSSSSLLSADCGWTATVLR